MQILSIMATKDTPKINGFSFENIIVFIQKLGFPVFMACVLGYFVWQSQSFDRELIHTLNEERREMIKVLGEQNQKLSEISYKLEKLK
jgi:hypothetical protein